MFFVGVLLLLVLMFVFYLLCGSLFNLIGFLTLACQRGPVHGLFKFDNFLDPRLGPGHHGL